MICSNGDITLTCDTFGEPTGRPLLLIAPMGAVSRLIWHEDFCAGLVDRGFRVARFDNRDAGASTHLDPTAPRYTLGDMAADAVAVLDALDWPAAHVVGASLGGMIGQVMAVHHASRVRTLTSMSSAPCNRWRVSRPRLRTLAALAGLVRHAPTDGDAYGEQLVRLFRIVGSPAYPMDERDEDRLRGIARQTGPDAAADARHLAAMRASGDRRAELAGVTAPTLVLHGEADPLQSPHAARATVRAMSHARLVTYPGMGHDLPRPLWPAITEEIAALADRADAMAAA